jgi:hypothetical protein
MADGFETDDWTEVFLLFLAVPTKILLMAGCLDLSVNPAEQRQI